MHAKKHKMGLQFFSLLPQKRKPTVSIFLKIEVELTQTERKKVMITEEKRNRAEMAPVVVVRESGSIQLRKWQNGRMGQRRPLIQIYSLRKSRLYMRSTNDKKMS